MVAYAVLGQQSYVLPLDADESEPYSSDHSQCRLTPPITGIMYPSAGTHKCRYVRVLVGDLKEIGWGALPMVCINVRLARLRRML